jgi:RHS repeat-associated protein
MSTILRRCLWLLWAITLPLSAQTVEYIHTDALGSPVAVTDANRNVVERSEYEPYGALLNRPLSDGPGYTGHVSDAATGLSYMQQRYYDSGIGRFLSVDPVTANSSTGGNFNRYWYANNNPYKFKDPDGRQSCESGSMKCHPSLAGQVRTIGPIGNLPSQGGGKKTQSQASNSQPSQKINSSSAFEHYKGGSGAPLRMNFGDIDTSNVKAISFPQMQNLISGEKIGVFPIDSRTPFSTSGDQGLFLGNITLRLQGTLTLDQTSYSFNGTLKSFDDIYDFNKSTHRGAIGELLTRFGATQTGTTYWIEIRGTKSITETGSR